MSFGTWSKKIPVRFPGKPGSWFKGSTNVKKLHILGVLSIAWRELMQLIIFGVGVVKD